MSDWNFHDYFVIYLPQYDEIICFRAIGMSIQTREGFSFPLKTFNSGKLIQISLGAL
jgi:hypothetical protein